ncbi:glucose-6-phosphate 1-epimerase [Skeletonema marinoi]|uniref:glucose-6-phosphate 1-epimerase n=1 Tax=Skeletonema marinoi TaxID=267567 RepID=A0AAD9DH56_9STRA|nr:glucose-6-phosphate 1-epimerase [Skeletonema marinoi]
MSTAPKAVVFHTSTSSTELDCNDDDIVLITHSKSGANCVLKKFGAHVLSYQTAAGKPLIMISKDAIMDGSAAIRGGIPLCFPQFGQPDKSYLQHGFLRRNKWTVVEGSEFDTDDAAGIKLELELKDVTVARGDGTWGNDTKLNCKCILTVSIDDKSMTNTLEMQNLGTDAFDFQVLLHTYYLVAMGKALDHELCNVKGFEGYMVDDKVSGETYTLGSDPVTIPDVIIDRVYTPPDGTIDLNLTIAAGVDNLVELTANGDVDGTKVPVSGVVWNPHKIKAEAMGDFGSDQYNDMICVEPGLLSNVPQLKGGKTATFTQVMTSI